MKKKVLILNGQYAPGYKGGGPIQSCINMVENLSDNFDFYVLCADRDYKDEGPYKDIKINQWNQVGKAKVFYMSPEKQSLKGFEQILNSIEYDVLYLNGFFSPIFTIRPLLLRRMGKLKNKKATVILTPRGDFTGGCENKKLKKYGYIYLAKILRLYRDLVWHATSEIESKDIKDKFPKAEVFIAPNLPAKFIAKEARVTKKPGELSLVFVSRIFPKKNIKFALEILENISEGDVNFDIYGPMEDEAYWAECEELIRKMPSNVNVRYCGEVEHKDIPHVFERYHAFFFPTLGENYGHVIVEAMMNNCLCILSKGVTPWDDYIEALHIGAKLSKRNEFISIIQNLIDMNDGAFKDKLKYAREYISKKTEANNIMILYWKLLTNGEEN
ncbi:glycosyltransferase family 4 protein [Bifidobacterium sp. SO1]|uniref:glycosyltransferase family 4 protein n=1 Tax=Bifidobacterium sp. SO1 TaxID=2809029 RepID=UPI001BDCCB53|nr:glycosyltransferase family 4 protein [Bifidobacterium sp. SO1]MBT1160451.1 glycosyltransferase family 4 protein [Bifidobacterium sp. SO1]